MTRALTFFTSSKQNYITAALFVALLFNGFIFWYAIHFVVRVNSFPINGQDAISKTRFNEIFFGTKPKRQFGNTGQGPGEYIGTTILKFTSGGA